MSYFITVRNTIISGGSHDVQQILLCSRALDQIMIVLVVIRSSRSSHSVVLFFESRSALYTHVASASNLISSKVFILCESLLDHGITSCKSI